MAKIPLQRGNSDMLEEAHVSTQINKAKQQSSVKKTNLLFNLY